MQVIAFVLMVGLLAHLSACVFYYMAFLDGLSASTWVAAQGLSEKDSLATRYLVRPVQGHANCIVFMVQHISTSCSRQEP